MSDYDTNGHYTFAVLLESLEKNNLKSYFYTYIDTVKCKGAKC